MNRRIPSVDELSDRGLDARPASQVLHDLLEVLYSDGEGTEWNGDKWNALSHVLDRDGLTYRHWPTRRGK